MRTSPSVQPGWVNPASISPGLVDENRGGHRPAAIAALTLAANIHCLVAVVGGGVDPWRFW
ncbi:hypothetical protein ACSMXN_23740 [Jatrophihabitans sp. DSM 45814]